MNGPCPDCGGARSSYFPHKCPDPQGDLFTQAALPPHVAGSDTSLAAAESMRQAAPKDRERVLDYIQRQEARGATADECLVALKLSHQNGSARVSDLATDGRIRKAGMTRRTRSGRQAAVYVYCMVTEREVEIGYAKLQPSIAERICQEAVPDQPSAQDLLVFVKLITVLLDARTEPPTGVRRVMLWLKHLAGDT